MELSKCKLSRRALLTAFVSGAGAIALIGGTTGIIPIGGTGSRMAECPPRHTTRPGTRGITRTSNYSM